MNVLSAVMTSPDMVSNLMPDGYLRIALYILFFIYGFILIRLVLDDIREAYISLPAALGITFITTIIGVLMNLTIPAMFFLFAVLWSTVFLENRTFLFVGSVLGLTAFYLILMRSNLSPTLETYGFALLLSLAFWFFIFVISEMLGVSTIPGGDILTAMSFTLLTGVLGTAFIVITPMVLSLPYFIKRLQVKTALVEPFSEEEKNTARFNNKRCEALHALAKTVPFMGLFARAANTKLFLKYMNSERYQDITPITTTIVASILTSMSIYTFVFQVWDYLFVVLGSVVGIVYYYMRVKQGGECGLDNSPWRSCHGFLATYIEEQERQFDAEISELETLRK